MEFMSDPMPSISILLVEDDELTLKLLTTILARKFPEVALYTAGNGRMGLQLFKEYTPDIIITDMNMPEMGGMQMADKIRIIKPGTKFIALSGNTGKPVQHDSDEKGFEFDHNIAKPVGFQLLFAAIEQCFGEIVQQSAN